MKKFLKINNLIFFIHAACVLNYFSCVWLFATPMNCSLPGSSVHGILQIRILGWGAISYSRGNHPKSRIEPSSRMSPALARSIPPPKKKKTHTHRKNLNVRSVGWRFFCSLSWLHKASDSWTVLIITSLKYSPHSASVSVREGRREEFILRSRLAGLWGWQAWNL